jgi:hypothetical protein
MMRPMARAAENVALRELGQPAIFPPRPHPMLNLLLGVTVMKVEIIGATAGGARLAFEPGVPAFTQPLPLVRALRLGRPLPVSRSCPGFVGGCRFGHPVSVS